MCLKGHAKRAQEQALSHPTIEGGDEQLLMCVPYAMD